MGDPSDATGLMLEDDGNDEYCESGLDKEASSESLGMLSQQTDYSMFGDNDISEIILALPLTQTTCENQPEPPNSKTPSISSLGKRKASESSFASSNESQNRPSKLLKPSGPFKDDNPFLDSAPTEKLPDNIIILSPGRHLQRWIVGKKIPYGVQFEIARLVSNGHLEYVDIEIARLASLANGTNDAAAPLTARVLLKRLDATDEEFNAAWTGSFAKELAAKHPWTELDKEESARTNDPFAGLGFDDKGTRQDFYGGRVRFRATLKDVGSKGKLPVYKFVLERAELGSSDQFSRRFGSKHFFRLKVPKHLINKHSEHLLEYLHKPVALCGHVFRAFYAKDANVFYVKTNEYYDGLGAIDSKKTFDGILSFLDFIKWHNNLESDPKQTMAKWASRFSLGLSNSAPGLLLSSSEIMMAPDIVSAEGSDMTDGAGTINRAGLRELRHHFRDWEHQPTCVQVRVFGAKGLLVEDKDDTSEIPRVQLRPSQIKIKYPREEQPDPAHLVIDVIRASHARSPCRLSVETIINLSENKVPKEAFIKLLKQGLDELVAPLLSWDNPKDMQALWCTLRRIGGVMAARKAREDAGMARVNGYSERDGEECELDDEDGFQQFDALEQRSSAWWGDEISGCPSGLEETVMCLLDAGFTPRNCAVCCDKLEIIVKKCVRSYIRSYRIDVPMSATAFLVPDTQGVLEPGEIFFKSSRRNLKTVDGSETDIVLGDVLLTRYPCKLPTDVQKWRAVDRPELHHLTDVIVCSTKGLRRAADFLAGGDYDGDKGLLIFQPELVEPFVDAPLHFSKAPINLEETNFSRHVEKVSSFLTRTSSSPTDSKIRELQKFLLGAFRDSTVGKYSTYHENAIYTKGYCHPTTIRLAYMFSTSLDGAKTGLTVRPEILAEDMRVFQARPPKWKETEEEANRVALSGDNSVNLTRTSNSLGTFIMDTLHREAELEGNKRLGNIEATFNAQRRHVLDPELVAPWLEATERAKRWMEEENNSRYQRDLEKIMAHVHAMYEKHRSGINTGSPRKPKSPKKESKASFTDLPIEVRQDKIRAISKEFASWPKSEVLMADEEVARLRASYAYLYDSEKKKPNGWTRFPWDVAMRELGAIKARATGRYKCVTGQFYDDFNMKHPHKHHT